MRITLASIVDKIIPTLIVAATIAIFGMYIRVGYLEQLAKLSVDRYNKDVQELQWEIKELRDQVKSNREDVIRLQETE